MSLLLVPGLSLGLLVVVTALLLETRRFHLALHTIIKYQGKIKGVREIGLGVGLGVALTVIIIYS